MHGFIRLLVVFSALGGLLISSRGITDACAGAPTMPGFREYPISFWWGPPAAETTKARYHEIAAAGFNLAAPPAPDKPGDFYPFFDPSFNLAALNLCHQFGVRGIVADKRIDQILGQNGDVNTLVDAIVADYKDHPALWGYYVTDEPGSASFPKLGQIVARFREKDPKHVAFINLLPNYASLDSQLKTQSYREYLERYVSEVKPAFICYDHYHFLQPAQPVKKPASFASEQERLQWEAAHVQANGRDRGGFFNNLESVRDVAKAHHLPFEVIVLLVTHGCCRDLTEAELRWEAFQCLAYGSSALAWFSYWAPPDEGIWHFRHAVVDWGGKPTDHYKHVQRINADVRALGNRLMGRESLAVFHVGPEADNEVRPFKPFGPVQAIDGGRLTVGFFEGGYVLLANKNYHKPIDVAITLSKGTKVKRFDRVRVEEHGLNVKDNRLTVSLQPGDAELIRLY
jgi:hypothetical protein